jgi:hypothetical protein
VKEGDRIKRIIQIKKRLIIPARSAIMISIFIREKIKLLKIRNFIFESISFDIMKSEGEMTTAIIDAYTAYVEIRNATNRSIIINRKRRLRIIEKYEIEEYYLITEKLKFLAIGRISWAKKNINNGYFSICCSEFNYDIIKFYHDNNRNKYIKKNYYRFRNYRI